MLSHRLAVASDLVTADLVEATEFPHLANKYQVRGVRRTVINETIRVEGAVPEAALMSELMAALVARVHQSEGRVHPVGPVTIAAAVDWFGSHAFRLIVPEEAHLHSVAVLQRQE
ncbi:MAG TPA: thioredoxin family protein [Vicinamibacterales bacterium]